MTREAFIEVLKRQEYPYEILGNKVVVTYRGNLYLVSLTSIPPNVVFRNTGNVELYRLTSLPPGVEFRNGGNVFLDSLTSLPTGVVFKNGGDIRLKSLTGGYFTNWKGNIEGIDEKRLLNKMIKDGVFER